MESQHFDYELLLAYAADELTSDSAHAIETHIGTCPQCSNVVRRFKLISYLMRTDDSREPPPATIARAQAIFAQNRPAREPFWQGFQLPKLTLSPSQFARAFVLIAFILANLILYGGIGAVAVSAQESIPGDSLYQTKLNIESIQLAVTWDTGDRVERHVGFADSRTKETVALVERERFAEIPPTLAAYEKEVDLVKSTFSLLVKENFKRAQTLAVVVETALARQTATLGGLRGVAIEAVKPALQHAIDVANAQLAEVINLSQNPPSPTPNATRLASPTLTRIGGSGGSSSSSLPSILRTTTPVSPSTNPSGGSSPVPVPSRTPVVPASPTLDKNTPPGLIRTPTMTPPGLFRTPTPTKTPTTLAASPTIEKSKTPPGQVRTQTPPGQSNKSSSMSSPPPSSSKNNDKGN